MIDVAKAAHHAGRDGDDIERLQFDFLLAVIAPHDREAAGPLLLTLAGFGVTTTEATTGGGRLVPVIKTKLS